MILRKVSLLIIVLFIVVFSYSQDNSRIVNIETAKKVGLNFFHNVLSSETARKVEDLILLKKYAANTSIYANVLSNDTTNYIYIFETKPMDGFIIISADNAVDPILAYSNSNKFVVDKIPSQINDIFDNYVSQIKYIKENSIVATDKVKSMWNSLENVIVVDTIKIKSFSSSSIKSNALSTSVAPLIKTKWDQAPLYNLNCPPYKDTYNDKTQKNTYTGCVATATAQVMNYWSYPLKGYDVKQYSDSTGDWTGNLSANFGANSYQWSAMSNTLSNNSTLSSIKAVSTLIGNVGIAVGMDYGYDGSSAYVTESEDPQNSAEYALKKYFNYSNNLHGVVRKNYTNAQWIDTLRTELSLGRPIIYAGFSPGSGHCFVVDGYDTYALSNNTNVFKFSINWGWSGSCDGYYNLDNLIPTDGAVGAGAGNKDYTSGQEAIIGIQPPANKIDYTLVMAANLISNPVNGIINYGAQLTINTNVKNTSNVNFNGDYAIFIFDSTLSFVDTLSLITNRSLPPNNIYTNNLSFTNSGLFRMLPGKYVAAIYFKPNGQGWQIVNSTNNFNNFIEIKVVNTNAIELNSSISTLQTTPFKIGDSLNVTVNVKNTSSIKYLGQYQLALYTLDGIGVQSIGTTISDTVNGLPPNYTYVSPYLKFNSVVKAAAGDYLLALTHIPKGGNSQLVGSTLFRNPIRVSIINSDLLVDKFENNDSLKSAYNINNIFTNDSLNFISDSSNIHNGKDLDYYKVALKSGYSYSVNLNVFDASYSANGKRYSLSSSVLYYRTNGSNWSTAYYNKLPNSFTVNGADTLFIFVGPKFIGSRGSYLLNVDIKRTCIAPSTPIVSSLNNIKNFCEGTSLVLNSNSSTGNQWYLNGTLIPNAIFASDTIKTSGSYSVIVNNGICSSAPSSPYIVTTSPIPSIPVISRDTANYLVSSSVKNIWYKDGVALSDSSQRVKYTPPGQFTVKAVQNGCISSMSSPYFMVTDIINISKDQYIKINPNPFVGFLYLEFNLNSYQKVNLEVFDISSGSKISTFKEIYSGTKLQLGNLNPSVYLIRVSTNDNKNSYQFKMLKL